MADDWQSLAELVATPAADDEVLVKDTSDTTDNAVGTVKRNSRPNFLGSILTATTASFTTADETKLDGIETLADVTDAANVAAAGAHMAGGTDVPVTDGGTGASTAANARTNLGLVIGTDVAPVNNPAFTGTVTVPNDSISYAEIQNVSATDRLLGRDTAAAGDIEELTVSGGLEFTGGPGIQRSALTGDVTASAGNNATTIAAGVVTYAKIQNISATDRLLGRSTAGAGVVEEITCTATGRSILDDTTTAAVLTTIGALPLAGGTLTGALVLGSGASIDGGGKVIAHNLQSVVTGVTGTLTITAHSGNTLVTSGNVTVPTTAGFYCTLIAGGAHTITFNSTVSAAMATGDIVSLVVQSGTVIHAIKVLAANKVAFA